MSGERYVGERRALWHFLSELRPLVIEALGEDALLRHRIDRALKTSDLEMLRQARRLFHNHPDELKRQLMRGIFEGTPAGAELPSLPPEDAPAPLEAEIAAVVPSAPAGDSNPAGEPNRTVVRFDAYPAAREEDVALSVELDRDRPGKAPVRVMVEIGTLPRSAAETLRQIADWIEHDRRMLSRQHWLRNDDRRSGQADETVDQA